MDDENNPQNQPQTEDLTTSTPGNTPNEGFADSAPLSYSSTPTSSDPIPTTPDTIAPQDPLGQESPEPISQTSTSDFANFNTSEDPYAPSPSPSTSTPSSEPPITDFSAAAQKPKKKSSSNTILLLIMFVITLCGVGFGIYGFFFQPPKEKIITKTIEADCEETCNETIASSDHIYIGEWGIKIKKPTGLSVNYQTDFNNDTIAVNTANQNITIIRVSKTTIENGEGEYTSTDGALYCDDTHCLFTHIAQNTEPTPETDAFAESFQNPENYSKF